MVWFTRIFLFLYGVLLAVGGWFGYHSKASTESLYWGIGGGVAAILAFVLSFKQPKLGAFVGLLVGGAITYVMGQRFLVIQKFMPAGMVALLSIAAVLICLAALFSSSKKGKKK